MPLPLPYLARTLHLSSFAYKSRGLGQAKPWPSRSRDLWLGLRFQKAGAPSGQAKAAAFRPSRAGTPLHGSSPFRSFTVSTTMGPERLNIIDGSPAWGVALKVELESLTHQKKQILVSILVSKSADSVYCVLP
jgi:hypothetical protein